MSDFSWSYDPEVDALYVYFVEPDPMDVEIGPSVWWTEEVIPARLMVDWQDQSHLFGVEVLGPDPDFLVSIMTPDQEWWAWGLVTTEQFQYLVNTFTARPWEES